MKKNFKILCAMGLGLVAIMGMAGCGKSDNSGLKIIDISVNDEPEDYAFAFNLSNTTLKNDFNTYLTSIKNSGEYESIYNKYFENSSDAKVGYKFNGTGTEGAGQEGGDPTSIGDKTESGKFVVATNCDYEPYEYIIDGKMYGFDIEVAAGYATYAGLTLEIWNIDFDAIFPSLDANHIDMGAACITSNGRESSYAFSDIYKSSSMNLIVKKSNKDFDNCETTADVQSVLSSLKGKTIGYQNGTASETLIKESYKNITGAGYNTSMLAAVDLNNNNIYAVLVDADPAKAIVNNIK